MVVILEKKWEETRKFGHGSEFLYSSSVLRIIRSSLCFIFCSFYSSFCNPDEVLLWRKYISQVCHKQHQEAAFFDVQLRS